MYIMVENELANLLNLWEDETFVAELDHRIADYESDKLSGRTWNEIKANL